MDSTLIKINMQNLASEVFGMSIVSGLQTKSWMITMNSQDVQFGMLFGRLPTSPKARAAKLKLNQMPFRIRSSVDDGRMELTETGVIK